MSHLTRLPILSLLPYLLALFFAPICSFSQTATLKVGAAIPSSGDFAIFGKDVLRGMTLAKERLASKGVSIDLLVEDSQYIPRVAVTAAQKLIEQDKVDVIISLWDTAEAVAPVAERSKTPHFSIRWNPHVAREFPHTFTFESTYITWIAEVIRLLRSEGAKRVSLMTDISGPAWLMAKESFLDQASVQGLSVVNTVDFMGATDNLNLASDKLVSIPSDYFVMLHYEPTLSLVMRKLSERRTTTPITGYFEGMAVVPFTEGRRFVAQFDAQAWFLDLFKAKYSNETSIKAPFGYDLIMILGELVNTLKRRPRSEEITRYLSELRNYNGATGVISTSQNKNIETTCVVKKIVSGKPVRAMME